MCLIGSPPNDEIPMSHLTQSSVDLEISQYHIALFIDSMDPGGAEEVLITLAQFIKQNRGNVTIMHFGNPWIEAQASHFSIRHIRLDRWQDYKSILRLPLFLAYFRRVLRAEKVDLLHSHLLGAAFCGAIGARASGIKSIGTLHDAYSLTGQFSVRVMLATINKLGSRLAVVTSDLDGRIKLIAKNSTIETQTIHNGIEVSSDQGLAEKAKSIAGIKFACVARLIPIKRIDLLISALSLPVFSEPWQLTIAGDGPSKGALEMQAVEAGITDRVQFVGFTENVDDILRNSDVFVLPSDSEGLSISILEAMRASLPVVAMNVGGNSELVENGVSGFLVTAGDKYELAGRLVDLMADKDMRERMGQAGQKAVMEKFSSTKMCERYLRVYCELLEGRR